LSWQIRPFKVADIPAVLELWRSAGPGVALTRADQPAELARFLELNPGLSFVAEETGRIIGAVICGFDGRRGYLHHLAVAEDFRRRGVGRALAEKCKEVFKEKRIEKVHLFVYDDNHQAKAFWEALGWELRTDIEMMTYIPPDGEEGK